MERVQSFVNRHRDILAYVFFGGLTTLVNFLVYFPLYNWIQWSGAVCNIVAWIISVAFAFITNKPFVFKSNDWTAKTVLPELVKFVSCRIGSGLMETASIWLFVDIFAWNGNLIKVVISVFVVALNYIGSKWLVFKKKE